MTEPTEDKSDLEKSKDIISQLKEMRHYAKTTIEKLTELWMLLDGEMKRKDLAKKFEVLLTQKNAFYDSLDALITDYEIECNRIENEAP